MRPRDEMRDEMRDDMRFVTGLLPSRGVAERAARELVAAGFAREDISLLVSAPTHARHFAAAATDDAGPAAKGATAGAATGGALGAIAATLVAVGLAAAPGVGLFAAGPG